MGEPARKYEQEHPVEKETDNWWESDKIDAIGWSLAFIWGALVLLTDGSEFTETVSWWDGWGAFFAGVGTITITLALTRLVINYRPSKTTGGLIFGLVLLGIGFNDLVAVWFWPVVLGLIGVSILASVIRDK